MRSTFSLATAMIIAALLVCSFYNSVVAANAGMSYLDIPMPTGTMRTPNMQTFRAGCLIIDMGERQIDNTDVPGKCTAGRFNLKVYGFAVRLLHAGIPLNWAIRSNKGKDDTDVVAASHRVHPTGNFGAAAGPWGATTTQANTFKGGPLIIRRDYVDRALQILAAMKSQQPYAGCAQSIVLFRLDQDTDFDIRHVLMHKPHVLVSTVSGDQSNWQPQADVFEQAGLIRGDIQHGHYQLVDNSFDFSSFEKTCHTMFTEPHVIFNTQNTANCPRCQPVPKYRDAVMKFIDSGGNFAAQCAAIPSYENSHWASQYRPEESKEGVFLSRAGIKAFGNTTLEWGGRSANTAVKFPHPDLPAVQFVGQVSGAEPGTVTEWYLLGQGDEKSLFINNGHSLVENAKTGAAFRDTQTKKVCSACGDTAENLLPDSRRAFIATGAKYGTTTLGGMVFYLASHSWFPSGDAKDTEPLINGRRILLNAMLTPTTRPDNCWVRECPDNAECPSAALLGTCQQCVCRNGTESVSEIPSRCGTCEVCVDGNCELDVSKCECEDCVRDSATGRNNCRLSKRTGNHNGNCTIALTGGVSADGDYVHPADGGDGSNKAAIVGGLIGGAIGGLALLVLIALIVAVIAYFSAKRRRNRINTGAVRSKTDLEMDTKNNPLFESNTATYENQLFNEKMAEEPHVV